MKKSSKILLGFIVIFLVLAAGAKYYKYRILKDYTIIATTACDPAEESCFIYECTPEYCDEEPYKYIEKKAYDFNDCNPYEDECPDETCSTDEEDCVITECSIDSLSEGESCTNE